MAPPQCVSIGFRAKPCARWADIDARRAPHVCFSRTNGASRQPRAEDVPGTALARVLQSTMVALAAAGVVATTSLPALALEAPSLDNLSYEQAIQRVSQNSSSSDGTSDKEAFPDADLFTDDALQGMVKLRKYSRYVQQLQEDVERQQGCESCRANRQLLEKVWQVVANEFYDPNDRFTQAEWGGRLQQVLQQYNGALHTQQEAQEAAQTLVDGLGDRYSAFLKPSQFRAAIRRPLPAERSYMEAQYVGVGLQLGAASPQGGRLVVAPLAESPAEAAGIKPGDRLLRIDGVPTGELAMDELTTLLRGPEGSLVELEVASSSPAAPLRELAIERQALPQPAVKVAQLATPDGGLVSYVRLHYFAGETTRALARALRQGEIDGVDGYVLDLRNNPGGVFEEAIACAQLLLDCHCSIIETVRNGQVLDNVFRAGELPPELFSVRGAQTRAPVVLLVNGASASASEVLCGALRDNGRATIIGKRTYGKGVIQYYFPIGGDGGGLKLTIAKYLTPSGYDITKQGGLQPDLFCDDYPHGIFNGTSQVQPEGRPDACVLMAMDHIMSGRPEQEHQQQPGQQHVVPESLRVLYAAR